MLVEVLDSFVYAILANIFSWESEPSNVRWIQGDGKMHEIDMLQRELLHVLHESVVVVSSWQIVSGVLVIL